MNAIVDQERRRVSGNAHSVEEVNFCDSNSGSHSYDIEGNIYCEWFTPFMQAEQVKPKNGWIYTFLTHHEVPDEVAKSCEKKLLRAGILFAADLSCH